MRYSYVVGLLFACCLAMLAPIRVMAQGANLPVGTEIEADHLEYFEQKKLLVGTGNVVVRQGTNSLSADYMSIRTDTYDTYARGNVVFKQDDRVWQGKEFNYNLKTKVGDFGSFAATVPPYYITAEESKRLGPNEVRLKNVTITTCDGEDPEYSIRAREAVLRDEVHLEAKGVTLNFLGVPFFWMPKLDRRLDAHDRYWEFIPGYSSRHGGYLLSAYNYRLADTLWGRTHFDYRDKRGFAVGQDFEWEAPDRESWEGELKGYYLDDDAPLKDDEVEQYGELVDSERYRLQLNHFGVITERDYFIGNVDYLSDPLVVRDFFDDDYRANVAPENRATITHRGDNYTAGLLVNKRLNDFYENVDRLPELSLDSSRQQLGDSGFYYETENSLAQLERVFPEGAATNDYDAGRFDTGHTVFYPTRNFGFLTLTPRAGYRGTYYSDTYENETATVDRTNVDTNGVVTTTSLVETRISEAGSDLRNRYELGFETSFKAFRTWDDLIIMDRGDGLRHIAEPYANYTYSPEPNLRPFQLPQFDEVDQIDKQHDVKFGIRNKYQTRYDGTVHDLVDANLYTTYRIDPLEDQNEFSDVFLDTELTLVERVPIEFNLAYDTYESEFSSAGVRATYLALNSTRLSGEYLYRREDTELVSGELVLFPEAPWSLTVYARQNIDTSELEEQSYFLERKTKCMGYGIGYKDVDDEYQVWVRLWLTAFPDSNIQLGQ